MKQSLHGAGRCVSVSCVSVLAEPSQKQKMPGKTGRGGDLLDTAEEDVPPLSVDGRALASRKNDCGVHEV